MPSNTTKMVRLFAFLSPSVEVGVVLVVLLVVVLVAATQLKLALYL